MPGGDLAARYPARMAMGILSRLYGQDELREIFSSFFKEHELTMILKQVETKFNSPLTSSAGRILDSIAALLCVCTERTYEGEPAMKLEALAMNGNDTVDIPVVINKIRGIFMLDTTKIIEAVLLARDEHSPSDIAASAQVAISIGLTLMAIEAARERNIGVIGFSGGVAYNDAIIRTGRKIADEQGFKFVTHRKVPCGDGGISLGQAVMAGFDKYYK